MLWDLPASDKMGPAWPVPVEGRFFPRSTRPQFQTFAAFQDPTPDSQPDFKLRLPEISRPALTSVSERLPLENAFPPT